MIRSMPERLEHEEVALGKEWVKVRDDFRDDFDAFFAERASDELKSYYVKLEAHLKKMEQQGIIV